VIAIVLVASRANATGDALKVHEWGTFTSIAGMNGMPSSWRALGGSGDLPCFVHRSERDGSGKTDLIGTVRMETPVLYVYAPHQVTISAEVRFPQGLFTEWYPQAELATINANPGDGSIELRDGAITWRDVAVAPNASSKFPTDHTASHYYAARAVTAASLRVGTEQEKFLFYRGVGSFSLPLSAQAVGEGEIAIENLGREPITGIVLFEKRGSKLGYRVAGALHPRARVTIDPPSLTGDAAKLGDEIERFLVGQGLYATEAKAMVETWHHAWFEEGTRLFYLVPRPTIDAVLPLSIDPNPDEIVRAFVGRLELITLTTLGAVEGAIANDNVATLKLFGRFVMPIVERISAERGHVADADRLNRLIAATDTLTALRALSCR
jgi:hypothetical protein